MSHAQIRKFASNVIMMLSRNTCGCGSHKLIARHRTQGDREFCPCCTKYK